MYDFCNFPGCFSTDFGKNIRKEIKFLSFWTLLSSPIQGEAHYFLLKSFQNKKDQKKLRYPTNKQSFSLETLGTSNHFGKLAIQKVKSLSSSKCSSAMCVVFSVDFLWHSKLGKKMDMAWEVSSAYIVWGVLSYAKSTRWRWS